MSTRAYRIHLQPEPEGGYTVTVPALPGCVTWGESLEHAMAMAREAIEGHLASLAELGQPIPSEPSDDKIDALIQVTAPDAA